MWQRSDRLCGMTTRSADLRSRYDAVRMRAGCFFFASRRRHTRFDCDWSSDVCFFRSLHDGNYGAVLNSTLSSRWTNQFLFGASYFNQLFHDNNNSFDTKAMGIFLSPDATNHGQPILGAPNIVIAPPSKGGSGGFEQIGLTPPEGRSDLTLHFTDIVSYSTGKHQFRFGAEYRHGN